MSTKQDPRKKNAPPGFTVIAGYSRPDGRVSVDSPEYGRRIEGVALALDESGMAWERINEGPWVCLGRPPAATAEE